MQWTDYSPAAEKTDPIFNIFLEPRISIGGIMTATYEFQYTPTSHHISIACVSFQIDSHKAGNV